jgi:MoxR-like ATPase
MLLERHGSADLSFPHARRSVIGRLFLVAVLAGYSWEGMMDAMRSAFDEVVTLRQAKQLIQCMAHEQSFLLLSAPGLGKSELVYEAAREAGLPCRSLLGTQIAPEDVSGIPRIVGERSVFCPPRVLLPEKPEPFCLFLDELPACSPDVQKAFYSLLLERRLGEHALPKGTWVVAAGNRLQDRALVRAMSSALVNRVTILQLQVDVAEWLAWAQRAGVRAEIRSFIATIPDALMRPVPAEPMPFSTPRAWALLSRALDMAQKAGLLSNETRRALAFGRLSPEDAVVFCALAEDSIGAVRPLEEYLRKPELLPKGDSARWFILDCIRQFVRDGRAEGIRPHFINRFLRALSCEHQLLVLNDMVETWGGLGADRAMYDLLRKVAAT